MKRRHVLGAAGSAASLLVVGCATGAEAAQQARFREAAAGIEASLGGGRLGVALVDTHTGVRHAWRGDERFPMCSTFKLAAAALVLHRVDLRQESLDRRVTYSAADLVTYSPATQPNVGSGMTVAQLCEAAVTLSDNTAANLLLRSFGGPEGFTAYLRELGDATTRLDRWETALNRVPPGDPRDTSTPLAMARTVQRVALGDALSARSREQLRGWLLANKVGDTRLRAGVPADWRVADKTGSGDNGIANDIGLLLPPGRAPLVVTCYIDAATRVSAQQRDAAIARVGRLAASLPSAAR